MQEIANSLSSQLLIVNSKYRILKEKKELIYSLGSQIKALIHQVDILLQKDSLKENDIAPFDVLLNK